MAVHSGLQKGRGWVEQVEAPERIRGSPLTVPPGGLGVRGPLKGMQSPFLTAQRT